MKTLFTIALCASCAFAAHGQQGGKNIQTRVAFTNSLDIPSGVDGWQNIIDETEDNQTGLMTADWSFSHEITVSGTLNITQIRIRVGNQGGADGHVKAAIYEIGGGDNLLAQGTAAVTVAPTDDDVWKTFTLDTPVANSGTITYKISFACDNTDVFNYYLDEASTYDTSPDTYSTFPPDPIVSPPTFDNLARKLVAGVFLDYP